MSGNESHDALWKQFLASLNQPLPVEHEDEAFAQWLNRREKLRRASQQEKK